MIETFTRWTNGDLSLARTTAVFVGGTLAVILFVGGVAVGWGFGGKAAASLRAANARQADTCCKAELRWRDDINDVNAQVLQLQLVVDDHEKRLARWAVPQRGAKIGESIIHERPFGIPNEAEWIKEHEQIGQQGTAWPAAMEVGR